MKTKFFKIIIMLAISLFLSAGVSLAHDTTGRPHKPQEKKYGYHKDQRGNGHHPILHKRLYKSYRYRHRPHDRYHRHYDQRKIKEHHRYPPYKRFAHRNGFRFGMLLHDPPMAFVVGAKGR